MAAPLLLWPLLSAFGAWLGNFLVKLADWIFSHWRLVKSGICCTIFITCFLGGIRAWNWVSVKLGICSTDVRGSLNAFSSPPSPDGSFLSILNYALPVNETLALTAAYISVMVGLLAFRGVLFLYKLVPFKQT